MPAVEVTAWGAWAPGLEDRSAWMEWSRQPRALGREGQPDVAFLPAMLRRRCGRLSRMMLKAAYECAPPETLAGLPSVFASRYGDTSSTVALLEHLARREGVSAAAFSHSVHNAPTGLFAMATRNHQPGSALAGAGNTFGCAFLEALGCMHRTGRPVLLVVGDEPLAAPFDRFADEPQAACAVALLLEAATGEAAIALDVTEGRADLPRWPQAAEFLRWMLSGERTLSLATQRQCWTWRRASG